ncbi:hypothetical protein L6452_27985 [Arctium lappa]|uniref:Uncharacterized protein n=1 Tax=Arctium lappa TaxID=4217 RepID=A0ACB8ZWA2_ARCLA|nr:hypothetical protein L6452_27985 [Arctium lappa]
MAISTYFLLLLIPYAASITFNLTNIGPNNLNHDIEITSDGSSISDEGIQLTPYGNRSDSLWRAGRATYINKLHLWDNTSRELASFTTDITFVIESSDNENKYSDGLTFFLAEDNSVVIPGASMGLPINNTTNVMINPFVAVEFDSFGSDDWDPKDSNNTLLDDHVGININSLASVTSRKWFSNIPGGRLCKTWITYDSASKNLSVSFTGFRNHTAASQVGLEYTIDLRDVLPEWVIFGVSAATGARFQKNNVKSWAFNSSDLQIDENKGLPPTASPDPVKGKIAIVVGLLVGSSILIAFVFAFFVRRRMKKSKEDEVEGLGFDTELNNEFKLGTGPRRFSYLELARSTGNFAENEKLGEGACGRKPIDYKAPEAQISLVQWVWELYGTGTLLDAADPRLGSDFEEEEIKCLMIVGLWCAHPESNLRPSMRQALQEISPTTSDDLCISDEATSASPTDLFIDDDLCIDLPDDLCIDPSQDFPGIDLCFYLISLDFSFL